MNLCLLVSPITFWLSVTSTSVSSMVLASGFLLAMQPIPSPRRQELQLVTSWCFLSMTRTSRKGPLEILLTIKHSIGEERTNHFLDI